ncbi:MAG: M28 family peptidase [Chitinophagaceae bacterium]|nr:M28 family peptidase [Chitinophagaceae bacterium]
MIKLVAVASLLMLSVTGMAQKKKQKAPDPQQFAATITTEDLSKHLYIIAGKEMEGRETATEGQRKAATYIENHFKSLGLKPANNGSYQQSYPVYRDEPAASELSSSIYGKIIAARNKGAAAVIMAGAGFPRRAGSMPGNQYTNIYKAEQYPNTFIVSDETAKAIAGQAWDGWKEAGKSSKVAGKLLKANLKLSFQKKTEELSSSNVLAYIEGSDKSDEWLIITAHYDHLGKRGDVIYYGADDDGSGTVGVLEIAEAFVKAKAAGNGPRRNVLFMTVSGEEKGLWGSEYFSEHPTVPMDKVTADLNIDMIGRTDTERTTGDTLNYVYVVGDDKLSTELKPISEAANNKYIKMTLDYKFNDPNDQNRIYYRSDHFNFARKGVPIIFYYDGMLKSDYHKPTDTPDKINYPLMAKRAQLVFHTAWEMANREALLKRDIELK